MNVSREECSYSVLMPVYYKDNPKWLKESIDSILLQSIKPSEFIIIKDGKLTSELDKVIEYYKNQHRELFYIKEFEENIGLGKVLAFGVNECSNEYILRMDADDYSLPDRCEKQLSILENNKNIDVVGSNVIEFTDNINNIISFVNLPEKNSEIIKYAKKRCPIRHPAIMYRKSKVLESGNYRDYRHAQDYNLVVHMIINGCKFYNIQEYLTYMRVNKDFYKRRGGFNQLKIVMTLKKEFLDHGFYSYKDYIISTFGNAIVCLMPNTIRKFIYKNLLRR
ncbi:MULTISPECIES: glycosyltransferase [Clostridium]|uniref:glycosyltransferase n=1 Tax=Clostridium TaxID=1485 RepID=UPI00189A3601|nr:MULTISPECIES: glycosyltransferase [Clostridium]MDI9217076.1 glycosyltransferase [Clostridium tertium]